jgi:hypothetical protein
MRWPPCSTVITGARIAIVVHDLRSSLPSTLMRATSRPGPGVPVHVHVAHGLLQRGGIEDPRNRLLARRRARVVGFQGDDRAVAIALHDEIDIPHLAAVCPRRPVDREHREVHGDRLLARRVGIGRVRHRHRFAIRVEDADVGEVGPRVAIDLEGNVRRWRASPRAAATGAEERKSDGAWAFADKAKAKSNAAAMLDPRSLFLTSRLG